MKITSLSEENLQNLFIEFPMPLALVKLEGGVEFQNRRFQSDFSPRMLQHGAVLNLIRHPDTTPLKTTLNKRDDSATPMIVHAIQLSNFILLVFDDTPGGVPDEEMQAMHRRLAELEKLSATDPLTGAWNRLPLKHTAEVEIKRSLRYHHPISLIFFDIDHFKKINDTLGHATGDAVLKELVNLVRQRIRESDTVYRWGGEEFVILATSTDHAAAGVLAESLRTIVAEHRFPNSVRLTLSLGVAEFLPGDDLELWLHRADKASYAAKARGRNQVVIDPFGGSDLWRDEKADSAPVKLVWHDIYTCGDATIDAQHEQLFIDSNHLIQLVLQGDNQDKLLAQLDIVLDATARHFDDEERILQQLKFPKFMEHREIHRTLLKKAAQLRREVVAGDAPVGHLLEYIVYDVVAKHILDADREYFPLVEAANNKQAELA